MLSGLGGLGGLGQFAGLMKYVPEIPGRVERIKARVQAVIEVGTTDCGSVVVEADGKMQIVSVKIDPAAMEESREALEVYTRTATNDALRKVRQSTAVIIREETEDMDIPGLPEMLEKMSGVI